MLVAIIVAYQVYVLAAVPLIEPSVAIRPTQSVSQEEIDRGGESVTRYQRLLAAYFSRDHWSQTRPPIVIESDTGSAMFVLDDWERHDDGLVELEHFALLIFPTPRQQSAAPPRDAIILEAPEGAQLQFDNKFRLERGEIGAIQRGEFPGKITIRSDMREPGPEDDLVIETTDLKMNSKLLYTPNEVRFRLGPNVGGGRELEIRLLEEETSKSKAGLKISSIDSLEIRRDVRLRVFLNASSLIPGDKPEASAKSAASASPLGDSSKPPVEVTCTGPFHFDFIRYVAGFDENVEVWQVNPEGPADQLSCDRLDLCFARKQELGLPPQRTQQDTASRQRADVRWLEPDRIIAEGHPVVIVSPSRGAEVRGGRVQLMLRQRKVAIEGGDDVAIAYGPNVLRAPQIQYQHPAADAGTKIGTFRASGPGTFSYVPDVNKQDQVFQAEWQASVELGRHNGQPVLTVAGRPRLAVTNMGLLTADQVRVFLREVEVDGKAQPIPDRMNAIGQVKIFSNELDAETRELSAVFRVENEIPAGAASGQPAANGLARFNLDRAGGPPARKYEVQSDEMQLEVALRGKRAAPTTLASNGNVVFRELPTAQSNGQEPFEVSGGQLTAERLDTNALVTIRGAASDAAGQATGAQLAQISARGMTVHAADVKLDVGQNRLWIDGPGTARLVLKRGLSGHTATTPAPFDLRWLGGLVFDGRTILVQRKIEIDGPDDRLRCDELSARLNASVNFGKRVDQTTIDVEEVKCRGHVVMDHKSRDEVDVTSHERMELDELTVNQQTGAISGTGRGVIRSTHFANQLPGLATPGAPAAKPLAAGNAKLHFLQVDFQQGLEGNYINREITFLTRVRTIYGPVDAWEQELDANRPELLPPETLTLTSEKLRINEEALTANHRIRELAQVNGSPFGPVQMTADGNVRINGQSPAKGEFFATADRVSYTQSKEQFILEGSNRMPATLGHRNPATGQQLDNSAGKIIYNRLTGQAEWDTVRAFEFTPGSGGGSLKNALGPAPARQ